MFVVSRACAEAFCSFAVWSLLKFTRMIFVQFEAHEIVVSIRCVAKFSEIGENTEIIIFNRLVANSG